MATFLLVAATPGLADDLSLAALIQPPPIDGPRSNLDLEYEAHVGGLSIAAVAITAIWNGERYTMKSNLITDGMAAKMFRARFENAAFGLFEGKKLKPAEYSTLYESLVENREVKIIFDDADPPLVNATPPYEQKYEVTPVQKREAVDPMSSMLHFIMGASATQEAPCGQAVPIYDGQRRYDIKIKFVKEIEISGKHVDTYSGPGYQCTIQYEEIAGFKPRSVRDKPYPKIKTYVASIENGRYLVPVRVNVDTDYGYLVIRASKLQLISGT